MQPDSKKGPCLSAPLAGCHLQRLQVHHQTITGKQPLTQTWPILLMMTVLMLCSVYFAIDVATEVMPKGRNCRQQVTVWPVVVATLALILGFEAVVLRRLIQQQHRMQQGLNVAAGALSDLMQGFLPHGDLHRPNRM